MRVSVIVPCYQAQATLHECLSSLLMQDFAGLEVLCVDDGSTDGTGEVLAAFAQDPRVRMWRTGNGGVAAARALGLSHARGDYVLFVDADDWLPQGAVERLYQTACEKRADIVSGDLLHISPGGVVRETLDRPAHSREEVLTSLIRLEGLYNHQCNKLIARHLFAEGGAAFQPGIRIGEDVLLNLALYHAARGFAHLPEVTYHYRQHEGSAMANLGDPFLAHLPMLEAMRAWLIAQGLWEIYWAETLYTCLWLLQKGRGIRRTLLDFHRDAGPLLAGVQAQKLLPEGRRVWRRYRLHLLLPLYFGQFLRRRLTAQPLRQIPKGGTA